MPQETRKITNFQSAGKNFVKNVAVILVGVQGPRNVGSICRAMGNFGCSDLRLVNPATDHLCEEALHMAVKAGHILNTAKVYAGLVDALADCHLSFGTTRRFGKYRKNCFFPEEAAYKISEIPSGFKAALIFGREDNGLTTSELSLCRYFMTIPTTAGLPSMNIAQAVAVCLYELFKITEKLSTSPARKADLPATVEQQEKMLQHMKKVMLAIEYLNPQNPEHIFMTYRRIMSRAELTERDIRILRGFWAKIEWATAKKRSGEAG
jgi:tRNA/rRNA methyltransferase